jgi:hypothetical protein
MTHTEAQQLLETNVSRGAMMTGFGCLTYFVPTKQVKRFTAGCKEKVPAGIELEVYPLNTTCKKGVFEYWNPSQGKDIPELILKANK